MSEQVGTYPCGNPHAQLDEQIMTEAMHTNITSIQPANTIPAESTATRVSRPHNDFNMGFVTELDHEDRQLNVLDGAESLINTVIVGESTGSCWDLSTGAQDCASSEGYFDTIFPSLSNIWTYQYQMGPAAYHKAYSTNQETSAMSGMEWTPSNSPFSEHLITLKECLRGKWMTMDSLVTTRPDL